MSVGLRGMFVLIWDPVDLVVLHQSIDIGISRRRTDLGNGIVEVFWENSRFLVILTLTDLVLSEKHTH